MKTGIHILLCACTFFILAGCNHKLCDEQEHTVSINFTVGSMLKSTATTAENLIVKLILYGVDAHGNVTQNFSEFDNPPSTGILLTINKGVKTLYAIANPSSDLMTANPSNLSELMNLTCDFINKPQSPFLKAGKGDVIGNSVQIELVRAVAKIEILSKNDFQINSVTVKNSPDMGYVFSRTPLAVPSSDKVNYQTVNPTNPDPVVVYVPENSKNNPAQFVVTGAYLGKQASYTIELKKDKAPIDIERNTHYQVNVSALTDTDCSVAVTIPPWNDHSSTISQVVTVPKPITPPDPDPYQDGIKILAIGNSYTQNIMYYMFEMLKKLGVPSNKIVLVCAYIAGGDMADHAKYIKTYGTENYYNYPTGSTNTEYHLKKITFRANDDMQYTLNTNVKLHELIKEQAWDLITLQQASKNSTGIGATQLNDINTVIDFITQHAINPGQYKLAWFMTWSSSNKTSWFSPSQTSTTVYNDIRTAVQNSIKLKSNGGPFDFIIPVGTAIQNARVPALFGDHMNRDSNLYGATSAEGMADPGHLNTFGSYIASALSVKTITGYDIADGVKAYTLPTFWNNKPVVMDAGMLVKVVQAVNAADSSPFTISSF